MLLFMDKISTDSFFTWILIILMVYGLGLVIVNIIVILCLNSLSFVLNLSLLTFFQVLSTKRRRPDLGAPGEPLLEDI